MFTPKAREIGRTTNGVTVTTNLERAESRDIMVISPAKVIN